MDENNKKHKKAHLDSRYIIILGVVVVLFVFFGILNPNFIRPRNVHDIIIDFSIPLVMALGLATVLAAGGFDMSIGAVTSFSGIVCAVLMKNAHVPAPVAMILTMLACIGVGLLNGFFITKMGVTPFIATLGMQFVLTGLRSAISGGRQITGLSKAYIAISKGRLLGFSNLILYIIIAVIVFYILFTKTKFGRCITAVGSNIHASYYSGINVGRYTAWSYAVSALMSGICGMLLLAKNGVATVTMGDGFMMHAITIAVFSQVIFIRFNSIGIFIAALIISMVSMGIVAAGLDPNSTNLVTGLILLAVIILGKILNSDAAKSKKAMRQLEEWRKANGQSENA